MDTIQQLKEELEHEYHITQNFFDRFPDGKNDYAPHPKSMKMMTLAAHIAEVFEWPHTILTTDTLDFAKGGYKPAKPANKAELVKKLEADYKTGMETLGKIEEKDLYPKWSFSMNGAILAEWSKYGAIRHALNQATHHRAQLGTYYRLLDIPVPGSYGPSADE